MGRKRKKKDKGESSIDPNGWMVTFSDLLTLLLTFFVLLLTMSSMDKRALKSMFTVFLGAADVLQFSDVGGVEPFSFIDASYISSMEMKKILEQVMKSYQEGEADYDLKRPKIGIKSAKNSVFLTFPSNILFEREGVDINEEFLPLLKELSSVLKRTDYRIRIEGHTDDAPVRSAKHSSKWQISALRSVNILRYFLDDGISSDRLTAVGYGEHRPVFTNDTPEYRARNRRVEIILERVSEQG